MSIVVRPVVRVEVPVPDVVVVDVQRDRAQ